MATETLEIDAIESDRDTEFIGQVLCLDDYSKPFTADTLDGAAWVMEKVTNYQKEARGHLAGAEAHCTRLREDTESQCALVMASAQEKADRPIRYADLLIRNFGLQIKAVAMAAINGQKKGRSIKFDGGVGTAALKKNGVRIMIDAPDEHVIAFIKPLIPEAVAYQIKPLTTEAKTSVMTLVQALNDAAGSDVVDVKESVIKTVLKDNLELIHEESTDETSGIITEREYVQVRDTFIEVPASFVTIKPEEEFTLSTPFGELELPSGMEGTV